MQKCNASYIGETGRRIWVRLSEHQKDNIALGKPTSQSTEYGGWIADKAVDGIIGKDVRPHGGGSCSATNPTGSRDAWWRVDLQQMSRIKTINITYRQLYPFRLSGFYLYVSNTTDVDNLQYTGHLCYHDDTKDPDLPLFNQSRSCPVDGKYVIFYNRRPADNGPKSHLYYSTTDAVVELCEVQVFGCPLNRFGINCVSTCHCGIGGCNPDTGLCDVTGCHSGWIGPTCSEECRSDTFGMNCNQTRHCSTTGCDSSNGSCIVPGCETGWQGNVCNEECGAYRFGENCLQTCHCALPGCDRFSGSCTHPGCEFGWTGLACNNACPTGHFGRDCKETCHCAIPGCNRFSGICILAGCDAGWEGPACDKSCGIGKYGMDCKYTCNCASPGCDVITGTCTVPGCEVAWEGSTCDIACSISSFGSNCTEPGCDKFTGSCNVSGCNVRWTGSSCDQVAVKTNSKDNLISGEKSGSTALVGYALLGSLLFISIGFNIGFIIDRLRTKRKKSKHLQSDNAMHYQNTVNVNENYDILDTSKVEHTHNIYDTGAK
ncbi:cell death abnormality protein 1-like [Mizuhopecten yessoensis]|uniref:cell death abnormality protein 1-like n=1 Tax=Mizuhopecten yessoensis TaxID=6573 RepID=UPI000B45B669|nr:cell death abnormality protein 1-like [Mizuhopecten yessoensis]